MPKKVYLLFLFSILVGCFMHDNRYVILFDRVDGLQVGSSVSHNGIIIGHVTNLELSGNVVLTDIRLQDTVKIPVQSVFTVHQDLLGSSQIEVDYSNSKAFVSQNDTIAGKYAANKILINLDSAQKKEIKKSIQKIAEGLNELVDKISDSTKNK